MTKKLTNSQIPLAIIKAWNDHAEDDRQWTGKLYRAGNQGIYYHTDPEGARFYEKVHNSKTAEYQFPDFKNALLINTDKNGDLNTLTKLVGDFEDIGSAIEDALPAIAKKGFDCLIIVGDTGADTWGVPIEVVDLREFTTNQLINLSNGPTKSYSKYAWDVITSTWAKLGLQVPFTAVADDQGMVHLTPEQSQIADSIRKKAIKLRNKHG